MARRRECKNMRIESTATGGRITWDQEDFLAGFVPDQTATRHYNETGAITQSGVDMFIQGSPGSLNVGQTPTTVGSASGAALVSIDMDPTANVSYMLGQDVYSFDVTTEVFTNNATFPHVIDHGHASETGVLGQIIHFGSASSAMFYSFNDATDGDVGVYFVAQSSFDDNFMSTVPTNGAALTAGRAHPIFVTSDDRLLIGDYTTNHGRIHSFKWTTMAFEANVLNLPLFMEPVGIVEEENGFDTVVFATTARGQNRRGKSKAFWWSIDRPASWYKASPIPVDEVSAPFAAFGTVGCFTKGGNQGGYSSLRLFENGQWIEKFHWSGALPVIGGVDVQDNTVVWCSAGKRYRWGSRFSKYPIATFQEANSDAGTSSGALKSLSNSTTSGFYMSSGTGNSLLEKFSQFGTGTWQGTNAAPRFAFGKQGKITGVVTNFSGGASGGGRTIKLDLNNETFGGSEVFSCVSSYTT